MNPHIRKSREITRLTVAQLLADPKRKRKHEEYRQILARIDAELAEPDDEIINTGEHLKTNNPFEI